MKKLTEQTLRNQLATVDRELERLEARRCALVAALETFLGNWKPNPHPDANQRPGSTMGMVRQVLSDAGKELTTSEIRAAIQNQYAMPPASSLATMIFREGSQSRSGIYRAVGADGIGRYGLLLWKQQLPTDRSRSRGR